MKCDLHVHTCFSYDSRALPEKIVEAALAKGIDCLAICDHGEIKGAEAVKKVAFNLPILIIPGIEVKSKAGDILGLNVTKIIPDGLSVKETIKRIKAAGGLAVIPHPFGWFCSFKQKIKYLTNEIDGVAETSSHLPPRTASQCLAIEVLNAAAFGPGNKKAQRLATQLHLPFTAGSDAHSANFVGKVFLEVPGENLPVKGVLEQIKQRNAKLGGQEVSFFEKLSEHIKRNLAKIQNAIGKKR